MPKDKREPQYIKSEKLQARLTPPDYDLYKELYKKAGNISEPEFIRQMLTRGYVQAAPERTDLEDLRDLRKLLIEYRTNFNRISNLIQSYDKSLATEVRELVTTLQGKITRL